MSLKLILQLILVTAICSIRSNAEENFWGNDVCDSSRDCTGLTECDKTFGCVPSFWKIGVLMLSIFFLISGFIIVCFCWRRNRNAIVVRHTTTIITNTNTPNRISEQINANQARSNSTFVPEDLPPPYSLYENKQNPSQSSEYH